MYDFKIHVSSLQEQMIHLQLMLEITLTEAFYFLMSTFKLLKSKPPRCKSKVINNPWYTHVLFFYSWWQDACCALASLPFSGSTIQRRPCTWRACCLEDSASPELSLMVKKEFSSSFQSILVLLWCFYIRNIVLHQFPPFSGILTAILSINLGLMQK